MTKLTTATLRALARQVDLPEIAVTDAEPFPEMIPWLEGYEHRGRTGFEASNIDDRIQPKRWMQSARSIIVAALPYLNEHGSKMMRTHPVGETYGIASCYTYGDDYHQVLSERLLRLRTLIEAHVGHSIEARVAVDTSPLVDRRIAERAGLGWIGKNAMFYSHRFGSYVFLGAMLVNIDVQRNDHQPAQVGSGCGSCTKCLVACPTGAIIAPGVIDATKCLSYITQMKGIIPNEFRERMGRRIWGCDVCQSVCPPNRQSERIHDSVFSPMGELAYPRLIELLHLSNRAFLRRFGHTALAWRGGHTLKRNALIAIGNTGRRDAVVEVVPFLTHPRVELRASAAWALGKLGGGEATSALQVALPVETNPDVVTEIDDALRMCLR